MELIRPETLVLFGNMNTLRVEENYQRPRAEVRSAGSEASL